MSGCNVLADRKNTSLGPAAGLCVKWVWEVEVPGVVFLFQTQTVGVGEGRNRGTHEMSH